MVQPYLITVHVFGLDRQTFLCQMTWVASHWVVFTAQHLLAIAGVDPRSFYETQSGLVQYATISGTDNTNTHVDVFLANAIQVKFTPGPLNVGIAYGAGEVDGDSGANSNMHIGVTYSTEDLTVMANYIKNKGNNAVNDSLGENEKQAVGAKYMMGDIKLAGYYIKGEATSAAGAG